MSEARSSTAEPRYLLDRREAVPPLIGDHKDFLFVTGLAGTARDIAHLTDDGANAFTLAGAMGAAVSMGLGLALAQPDRRVVVVTGDGELLMNVGSLATVSVLNPPNLSIVCVDNGHYGETGYQLSHTSRGVDLEQMAIGAGFKMTTTIETEDELADGAHFLREGNGSRFLLMRVKPEDPPSLKRILDASACRVRFRMSLIGQP